MASPPTSGSDQASTIPPGLRILILLGGGRGIKGDANLLLVRNSLKLLCTTRFDGFNHWIGGTEMGENGQAKRRNCKQCTLDGHKDNKTVFLCEKCEVPLHTHCFKDRIHCNSNNIFIQERSDSESFFIAGSNNTIWLQTFLEHFVIIGFIFVKKKTAIILYFVTNPVATLSEAVSFSRIKWV
jgi:hypothetical protein